MAAQVAGAAYLHRRPVTKAEPIQDQAYGIDRYLD